MQAPLHLDDGSALVKSFPIAASSRLTVDIGAEPEFAAAAGHRFGVLVESVGPAPAPIVVEASVYTSIGGVRWIAGRAALANRIK